MDTPMFIMMVGLPGSGKSTYAKMLAEEENAIVIASDQMRIEMFGDVNDTAHNHELFAEIHKRIRQYLKEGKNVIFDATNYERKKREQLLQTLPADVYKVCYFMDTPYEVALKRNATRSRTVPVEVIKRMAHKLQRPVYDEGWDVIWDVTVQRLVS